VSPPKQRTSVTYFSDHFIDWQARLAQCHRCLFRTSGLELWIVNSRKTCTSAHGKHLLTLLRLRLLTRWFAPGVFCVWIGRGSICTWPKFRTFFLITILTAIWAGSVSPNLHSAKNPLTSIAQPSHSGFPGSQSDKLCHNYVGDWEVCSCNLSWYLHPETRFSSMRHSQCRTFSPSLAEWGRLRKASWTPLQ
jgi:hypothetical protein